MNDNIAVYILGIIFFIDWLVKSFITGCFIGERIYAKMLKRVNKELDHCNYFGEDNVDSKK